MIATFKNLRGTTLAAYAGHKDYENHGRSIEYVRTRKQFTRLDWDGPAYGVGLGEEQDWFWILWEGISGTVSLITHRLRVISTGSHVTSATHNVFLQSLPY